MSIVRAVAELNEEIERLTTIRDSLLQGSTSSGVRTASQASTGRARSAKRAKAGKKSAAAKKSGTAKKRTMSPEARKRISEANKARWAKIKKEQAKAGK